VKHTAVGRHIKRKATFDYDPVTIKDGVLFIDEASLLCTKDAEKLLRLVREQGAHRVVLLGDVKQHQAIGAGQPFGMAINLLGEARLTHIIRQKNETDREVSRAIARGDAAKAIHSLRARGRLHEEKTAAAAMEKMVQAWSKEGLKDPKNHLLLCSTNAERSELNRLAHEAAKKAGKLGRKSVRVNGEDFHTGSRIAFTKNSRFYGVANGEMGTITRIGRKRITRKTFHGKQFSSLWAMLKYAEKIRANPSLWMTVKLDSGKTVDIELDRYQQFRLGFCLNSFQAQGQTVLNCYCLVNAKTLNRESLYVSATRARQETHIWSAGLNTNELILRATRSRRKRMAHDVLDHDDAQHHQQKGHER
jgi:ATP-dependent exoDNAse (exonuclease V) alpha subunit